MFRRWRLRRTRLRRKRVSTPASGRCFYNPKCDGRNVTGRCSSAAERNRQIEDWPAPVLRVSWGDGAKRPLERLASIFLSRWTFFFFPRKYFVCTSSTSVVEKKKFDHKPVPAGVGSVRFRLRPPPLHVRPGRRAFETLEEGVGTMALKVASSRVIWQERWDPSGW